MPQHHGPPIKVNPRRERRNKGSLGSEVEKYVLHVSNRGDTKQQDIGEDDAASMSGA